MAAGDAAAPAAAASATADWRYILERLYKEQDLQCAEAMRTAAVSTSSFVFLHRVSLTFTTMLCLYKSENLSKIILKILLVFAFFGLWLGALKHDVALSGDGNSRRPSAACSGSDAANAAAGVAVDVAVNAGICCISKRCCCCCCNERVEICRFDF